MVSSTITTVLLTLITFLPAFTTADFSGRGQLRTLWSGPTHDDLGCLTTEGKWTTNEALCGVFEATTQPGDGTSNLFRIAPVGAGGCVIDLDTLRCGTANQRGGEGAVFGTYGMNGPVRGREVLRYGAYGVMAGWGNNPPLPSDQPVDIHLYSGREKGKWVWLGWKPV